MRGAISIRPLPTAVAVLGAIAVYVGIAHITAPSSDDAVKSGETAPVRTAAPSRDAAVQRPPVGGNPLWTLPLNQLSITRERPIFSPSRHPPPPATPTYVAPVAVRTPPKPKEPEWPSITLLGTIVGTSEGIGIFLNPATQDVVRLRLGEDHQGWALRSVKAREVTLVKDRERVVLELPLLGDRAAATEAPRRSAPAVGPGPGVVGAAAGGPAPARGQQRRMPCTMRPTNPFQLSC
jgi:hypothetical protein